MKLMEMMTTENVLIQNLVKKLSPPLGMDFLYILCTMLLKHTNMSIFVTTQ